MQNIAPPDLIRYLLKQARPRQATVASELDTSAARVSRIVSGALAATTDEFVRVAHLLALGTRSENERDDPLGPSWVVTRWHADATIELPPLTRDGRLPVFPDYAWARPVAVYLSEFINTGSPVAVPVWRSFLTASLEARGLDESALLDLTPPGDAGQEFADRLADVMAGLYPGFVAAREQRVTR